VPLPLLFQLPDYIVHGRISFCLAQLPLPARIQLHIDREHANEAPDGNVRIAQFRAEDSLELKFAYGPAIN
jgi:hypothetical protein